MVFFYSSVFPIFTSKKPPQTLTGPSDDPPAFSDNNINLRIYEKDSRSKAYNILKMDLAGMLSEEPLRPLRVQQPGDQAHQESQRAHQYPTRHSVMSNTHQPEQQQYSPQQSVQGFDTYPPSGNTGYNASPPMQPPPKNVAFELLFDGHNNERARLPMRVRIYPHDTTDSIVSTVRDFYGLYAGVAKGVSFEDSTGITLIARYENFDNNMVVYVRVIPDYSPSWQQSPSGASSHVATPISAQRTPHLDAGFEMAPPQPAQALIYGQQMSRPPSRVSRKQSTSPGMGRSRRSVSAQKERSRSNIKSRGDSFQAHLDGYKNDVLKYSSSDEEGGSVTSSRKARNEQLASAEISEANIVEGGRRQRAKFESSELPLFVPPQVPAANSISSISPQRRTNGQDNPSPFARPAQRPFSYSQPLQSPQSYGGFAENPYGISPANNGPAKSQPGQHDHRLRDRVSAPGPITRFSSGSGSGLNPRAMGYGILPTPDPTIASCISDEDVALQLMRLGDASNFSSHGRTSASTLDDTLSGKADIASSASSDDEEDDEDTHQPTLPQHSNTKLGKIKRQYGYINDALPTSDTLEPSGDEEYNDEKDDPANEYGQPTKRVKLSGSKSMMGAAKARNQSGSKKFSKSSKPQQQITSKKIKPSMPHSNTKTAMSPPALPPHSRKASAASSAPPPNGLEGDDDLSTKPRCQRCRKSKKGCDRQRPCQRCQDAGIGAEGCISEDEGNGRKGRYGRHMGVPAAAVGGSAIETEEAGAILDGMTAQMEKNKKRKRAV